MFSVEELDKMGITRYFIPKTMIINPYTKAKWGMRVEVTREEYIEYYNEVKKRNEDIVEHLKKYVKR